MLRCLKTAGRVGMEFSRPWTVALAVFANLGFDTCERLGHTGNVERKPDGTVVCH